MCRAQHDCNEVNFCLYRRVMVKLSLLLNRIERTKAGRQHELFVRIHYDSLQLGQLLGNVALQPFFHRIFVKDFLQFQFKVHVQILVFVEQTAENRNAARLAQKRG